ncbi:MAG: hypothetical protein HKN14_10250 [Marinicaulis sp.]|nr:hypothetical protein [Marinicaulis sp.]NNE41283.1 hypothetical protein [Marinicaulis sp.]NNL89797.1 hypothetical protein [Marinicaulis sp.]
MRPIIIVAIIAALAFGGWYFYNESQKSELEKAAEDVADELEDAADELDG